MANVPVHNARFRKTWFARVSGEELKLPALIPDFNPTEHFRVNWGDCAPTFLHDISA